MWGASRASTRLFTTQKGVGAGSIFARSFRDVPANSSRVGLLSSSTNGLPAAFCGSHMCPTLGSSMQKPRCFEDQRRHLFDWALRPYAFLGNVLRGQASLSRVDALECVFICLCVDIFQINVRLVL